MSVKKDFTENPLIWMHHCGDLNNGIYCFSEKPIRIAYVDQESFFWGQLINDKWVCIHGRNRI